MDKWGWSLRDWRKFAFPWSQPRENALQSWRSRFSRHQTLLQNVIHTICPRCLGDFVVRVLLAFESETLLNQRDSFAAVRTTSRNQS